MGYSQWGHKETEQLSTHIRGCGPRTSQLSTPRVPRPEPCPTEQQRDSLGAPGDADQGLTQDTSTPPGLCCPHSQVPSP